MLFHHFSGVQQSLGASTILTLTNTDDSNDATNLTTYTFSNQSFGSPNSSRKILVGILGRAVGGGRTVSSGTIGGVSFTVVDEFDSSGSSAHFVIADVPSGSTGDIIITFNSAMVRAAIVVWAITNLESSTMTDSFFDTVRGSVIAGDLNVDAGGIVAGITVGASTPSSFVWGSELIEDVPLTLWEGTFGYGAASNIFPEAQSPLDVIMTPASTTDCIAIWVSFR